jgi:mannose-1-phosphate guanylyltransferase
MSVEADYERWVVLLAGGIGSRFWPASTPARPKQFLALAGGGRLIADTLERAQALTPPAKILIVAGQHLRTHLQRYLPQLPSDQLLLEPQARGTAPALAWAAHQILARANDPDRTVMISLHSDHVIRPLDLFTATMDSAVEIAGRTDRLLTIGIEPTRPETGYGYIQVGGRIGDGVFEVRRFVEKPDRETAAGYLEEGGYLWNSGMFVWRPQVLLAELSTHTPEIEGEMKRLWDEDVDGFFANVPTLTIDYGLMERSPNIAVVESRFEWDDVGAWSALMRVRDRDERGNLLVGSALAVDCDDVLVWAEDGPLVAFGLSDVVLVRASGITLAMPLDRAADLKDLLDELPPELREGSG